MDPIITQPNIAKSMAMEERIWEIPCEGIELSDIQEDDSTEIKIDASISDTRDDNPHSDFIASALSKLIRDASAFRRNIYEAKENDYKKNDNNYETKNIDYDETNDNAY